MRDGEHYYVESITRVFIMAVPTVYQA